jgi:hypothetical protein
MLDWPKRHERALWWAVLLISIVVGYIRNPGCSAVPWWAYVLPLVIFLFFYGWFLKIKWDYRDKGE